MAVYLDCNSTTPIDPEVLKIMNRYLTEDFGNEGSHTHEHGMKAKKAVQEARDHIGKVVDATRNEVVFTSGATESNNIAILGLKNFAKLKNKKHIISSTIEHKAVLEPLEILKKEGFEIELVKPDISGRINADHIIDKIRDDTLLISLMHVNNETGIIQPIDEVANKIINKDIFFHVDAAQSFGKIIDVLKNKRIDLISISGHKIYGPKGIGVLITRLRDFQKPPLEPITFGGGQERGLRPGTLPVFLVAGLGKAAEVALKENKKRVLYNKNIQEKFINFLKKNNAQINGDTKNLIENTINFSIEGIDSEAFILTTKDIISVSNGSACTSSTYEPSHVIKSMTNDAERLKGAIRISWCHQTVINDDIFCVLNEKVKNLI
jgi:cysteine desulfurase